jgi:hypothetical protein
MALHITGMLKCRAIALRICLRLGFPTISSPRSEECYAYFDDVPPNSSCVGIPGHQNSTVRHRAAADSPNLLIPAQVQMAKSIGQLPNGFILVPRLVVQYPDMTSTAGMTSVTYALRAKTNASGVRLS